MLKIQDKKNQLAYKVNENKYVYHVYEIKKHKKGFDE